MLDGMAPLVRISCRTVPLVAAPIVRVRRVNGPSRGLFMRVVVVAFFRMRATSKALMVVGPQVVVLETFGLVPPRMGVATSVLVSPTAAHV